jgi:hypothetical protein
MEQIPAKCGGWIAVPGSARWFGYSCWFWLHACSFAPSSPLHRSCLFLQSFITQRPANTKVRASIENQCSLIAEGRARIEDVVTHALDVFERKFVFFQKHIDRMDEVSE